MTSAYNNTAFRRPPAPILKIQLKWLWYAVLFVITLTANMSAGAWVASSYKSDYDNRLKNLEQSLQGLPEKLYGMEGKLDVILNTMKNRP